MSSPESRHAILDTLLILGITGLITAIPLLPDLLAAVTSGAVASLTAIAWVRRCPAAAAVGLFCVVCLALALVGIGYSQLTLGAGLLAYAWATRRVAWLEGMATWMRRGALGVDVWLLVSGCAVVAAVALGTWYRLFRPDLSDIVAAYVPTVSVPFLVVGGLLFSMINATVEEGAYRGVVQHGLEAVLGAGIAALGLQAVAFGALHINGFPRGWVGVGLATVYGLMLGAVRRRSGGMLAPWIAHVLTDVVIASIVLMFEM